jgi:4-carboxymuconolactone decarboxylase
MRRILVCAIMCLAGVAMAESPTSSDLHLRGDRFKPLTRDELTPEQKALVEHILSGPRGGSLDGPFNVYLRSPELGDLAQKMGAQVRYHSSLSRKLNEFAILITGRYWNAQFEWYAHRQYALQAGLSPAIIDALAAGKRPAMQKDEEAVYNFCTEMLQTKQASDATFQAAKAQFGERGVVDMIGIMGYYTLVSMALNADRYPLPNGAKAELTPLK